MKSNLVKLKFIFDKDFKKAKTKQELVDFIIEKLEKQSDIKYAGYSKKEDLKRDLIKYIGDKNINNYQNISKKQRKRIRINIIKTIKKLNNTLPHPDPPIYIFIYPWFPKKEKSNIFKSIMASASYYTIHLFIELNNYTQESLRETLIHEWNHLVFYRYHSKEKYTLLEHMIIEGLAEVFREEVIGGEPAPWAIALNRKEAQKQLNLLKGELNKEDRDLYKNVFFGNDKFKKWTGYSIGYWLIKQFREENPNYSWEEILKCKLIDK